MAQIKRMSDIHKLTYKFKDKYDSEKDWYTVSKNVFDAANWQQGIK